MRPISLTMCAFGSYGRKQSIDFTTPEQNLFLVTGDTGAGKTTIFDAIVFALYGEASSESNKKDGLELHSQYVDYSVEPYVELIFSEAEEEYTVRREPRHYRLMKNGKRKANPESAKVSLIMPDGTEYPQKETDKKIQELVGLTKEQFMQVAMIAQGEFMQLLREKSDKKKEIFRKLFGTEIFENIVRELNNRKRNTEKEMAIIKTVCQTEVGRIETPEEYQKRDSLSEHKDSILKEDKLSSNVLELLMSELEELCAYLKEQAEGKEKEVEKANEEYTRASNARATASDLETRFGELESAKASLEECKQQEEDIEEKRKLIDRIKNSYVIKAEFDGYYNSKKSYDRENESLEKDNKDYPALEKVFNDLKGPDKQAEDGKSEAEKEYAAIAERVKKAKDKFQQITKLEREIKTAEENEKKLAKKAEDSQHKLDGFEKEVSRWRSEESALKGADVLYHEWKHLDETSGELQNSLDALKTEREKLNRDSENLSKLQSDCEAVEEDYKNKNNEFETKQSTFFNAQAGILAKKLKPGCPCPVCGSLEHPTPCEVTEEAKHITQELLDTLKKEADVLREKWSALANKTGTNRKLLENGEESWESSLKELSKKITEQAKVLEEKILSEKVDLPSLEKADISSLEKCLEHIQTVSEKKGKELEKNAEKLQTLQKNLSSVEEKRADLQEANEKDKDALQKAKEENKALIVQKDTLTKECEYPSIKEADEALQKAKSQKDKAVDKYNEIHGKYETAKTEKENCAERIKESEKRIPALKNKMNEAKENYQSEMENKNLSEDEWKATVKEYPKDTKDMENKVKAYDEKKTRASALYRSASSATEGKEKPDMVKLSEEERLAKQMKDSIAEDKNRIDRLSDINETVFKNLSEKMDERKEMMHKHGKIEGLYSLLSGNVSGGRMDIETYAQRYYLEQILDAANIRFQDMSAGQFELRMYDIDKAGEGKNRGLDLMVYSTITGKEREVRTLSGGESFMAALSLALGMADEIQAKSSAINLDIMFIDEGFGSLDDHSRNEAVKVLKTMAGGSRLIGIISHVSELKQEIDDQLIVEKDEKGSRVRWN